MRRLPALVLCLMMAPPALAAQPDDGSSQADGRGHGLMPARVQSPISLMFLRLSPTRGSIPPAGRGTVELVSTYTSYFRADDRPPATLAILDGELWRNSLRARLGLGRSLALEVEIPSLYGGGGFLDSIIIDYHDIFGFNQEGRDKVPNDLFEFILVKDRRLGYRMAENELGLGDVSLTLDWALRGESARAPWVMLRAAVELPTGDEKLGFGNGHTDGGLGVALGKRIGAYHLFGNVSYQFQSASDAFEFAGVSARDNWVADLGVERSVGRKTALLLQFGFEESPVTGTALPAVDDNSGFIQFGLYWDVSERWRLDFAFLEDLDGESTQDFNAHLGVTYAW